MIKFKIYKNCRLFSLLLSLIILNGPQSEAYGVPFTKVVLDAGHGGHDLGGTFGLTFEKHLALDVVRRVVSPCAVPVSNTAVPVALPVMVTAGAEP